MTALASIILGVLGWLIAKFFFEPYKEIADLRRETQEALIIHGNIGTNAPMEDRRAAFDAFRRIGASLVSHHLAGYPWTLAACRRLNWDIHSAGALLIRLGNEAQFEGRNVAGLAPNIRLIRQCLKLREPETQRW